MPADRPHDDDTEERPLVVPVSDAIGAVDLAPLFDDTPTGEQATSQASPTQEHATVTEEQGTAAEEHGTATEEHATVTEECVAATRPLAPTRSTPVAGTERIAVPGPDVDERPRRRWPRRLLLGLAIVVVVAVGYFAFNLWDVHSTGNGDQARPVDAIVVMGAAQYDGRPSPQLEARLDHVLTLWAEGLAPSIVVTGGNLPGDRFTEAEASGTYLIERGVPSTAILYENVGSNTYDSLLGVAAIMDERGLDDALIVTDPYHALRSRMTAEELGISASVSPTPSSVVTGATEFRRDLGEAAGVALGRIIGFDRLASLTG